MHITRMLTSEIQMAVIHFSLAAMVLRSTMIAIRLMMICSSSWTSKT
jgi:hypothetical protein